MGRLFKLIIAVGVSTCLFVGPASAQPSRGLNLKYKCCKTLSNTPHNINGGRVHVIVPTTWSLNNWVKAEISNDDMMENKRAAMGADIEYFSHLYGARIGIWANKDIQKRAPRSILARMSRRMQQLTGGKWSSIRSVNVAGIPASKVTGVDLFGNYHYELYAWTRYGQTYAMAVRVPYEKRWDSKFNSDVAYILTHIHPSYQWVQAEMGYK